MSLFPVLASVSQNLPERASYALLSSIWEGLALLALTGVLLKLLPQTTARLRFAVWSAAFMLATLLPVLNFFLASHASEAAVAAAAPLQIDPRWSYLFTAVWLSAITLRSLHLAKEAVRLHTLWRSAVPVEHEAVASLSPLLSPLLKNSKAQLCTSTELDRPGVIGFFAPRILIPAWLFAQMTSAELHQVVLHELEHLRRRDDWLNLAQKLSLVIFPLNPALLLIDRRLAAERELACDDGVLEQTSAPRAYATCLTSLAERRLAHGRGNSLAALALGAMGALRRSEFSRRIESILSRKSADARLPFRGPLAFATTALLGFAVAATQAPQIVSFAPESSSTRRAAVTPAPDPIFSQHANESREQSRFVNTAFDLPDRTLSTARRRKAGSARQGKGEKFTAARPSRKLATGQSAPATRLAEMTDTPAAPPPEQGWMVLTSWHQSAPNPMVVTLPDGSTLFATYPATPTEVDWLLIQL